MTLENEIVKASVERQRAFNAYGELSHASWVLLENTKQKNVGTYYECMTAILITAFKYEAFLNRLGDSLIEFWPEMDRLPWKVKTRILAKHLGKTIDWGQSPYQTLIDLFKFRNALAHGRPENLSSASIEEGAIEELRRRKPLCSWEQRCNLEFAMKVDSDTERVISELVELSGRNVTEFRSCGHGYSFDSVVSDQEST